MRVIVLNGARKFCNSIVVAFLTVISPAMANDVWREPLTEMEFVRVEKGCFNMGVPKGTFRDENVDLAKRAETESPQHEVCLEEFWVARFELTEAQRQAIDGARPNEAPFDRPVAGISWIEANALARRLSELSMAGSGALSTFRLPTEAEWEYMCRAGKGPTLKVPDPTEINEYARFSTPPEPDSDRRVAAVQPVGGKKPNPWGLYDTLGNAWEWVQDAYVADGYAKHSLFNPVISGPGPGRVIRGGSIRTDRRLTRCEARAWLPKDGRQDNVGVRLVRIVKVGP